jgi:hypothetical protein|tara:strand:+ start:778 stop:1062 length:285 start_codon:yes stop_codon:yes gene_type:complete
MKELQKTIQWIRDDYSADALRFTVEVMCWIASLGCSIVMALTVPNPPLKELYMVWIMSCIGYAWAAWTRRSFGMVSNYFALVVIDLIGLFRIII